MKLVLDDFGTGYSSLSYLKHLPLDTIKIDRSFVNGLTDDDANRPIVQAVIALAHGLGLDVVAEGIETAEQLAALRDLGCDRGQGYYYAKPLPPEEIVALLGAGSVLLSADERQLAAAAASAPCSHRRLRGHRRLECAHPHSPSPPAGCRIHRRHRRRTGA